MISGVDISNWTAVPSQARLDCWWLAGVRFVIVGTQRQEPAASQLAALHADGRFQVELYFYPYYNPADRERVDRALAFAHQYGLSRIWDDVEWNDDEGPRPGPEVVLPALRSRRIHIEAAGIGYGIYSGEPYWKTMAGNTSEFGEVPLWHAWYFNDGHVPDFSAYRPYGGWSRPLIWQYKGSTDLCGLNVDLNAAESAFWEEADMNADELAKKERLIARIVATLKREDYQLAERQPDPVTGEPVVEVLSGVATDDALLIRIR